MSLCMCGHGQDVHGRADAQTAWQSACYGDADCDCDDYSDCDDPCWTCGGRGCPDCRDQRCTHCHNYWDTPGHFYGCLKAADDLSRSLQEEGL